MHRLTRALPAAGLALLLAACGSSPVAESLSAAPIAPSPSESEAPSPSPSPSPSAPAPEPDAFADAMPLAEGPLEPGRYTTTHFEPQLAFTLGSGWAEQFPDDSDEIALIHDGGFMAITRVSRVIDPSTLRATDVPDDLFAWLTDHDALDVERIADVTVAGLPAQMLEARVESSAEMFAYPTGNMRVVEDDHVRYYVIPLEGPDLTLVAASQGTSFEDVVAAVEPVVESLEIAP